MVEQPSQSVNYAKFKLRDEKGRFVSSAKIKTKIETSAPPAFIPEFEKPLLQISLTNPFKKILYWLNEIRRRQTTTLAIKLSIPLIALPVLVFAAFQFGKSTGISFQKSQVSPQPALFIPQPEISISKAGILKIAKSPQLTRYLLQPRFGDVIILQIPQNINLAKYSGKLVLVTGSFNKTTNSLTVTDIAEVEILNTTVVLSPESTSSSNVNQ